MGLAEQGPDVVGIISGRQAAEKRKKKTRAISLGRARPQAGGNLGFGRPRQEKKKGGTLC